MEAVNGLFVYSYQHDDYLEGWIPVEKFTLRNYSSEREQPERVGLSPEEIDDVRRTLKLCGWEGDGTLDAMLVPPFFASHSNPGWFPVFHVKQSNNGISWIASVYELSTENLNQESLRK